MKEKDARLDELELKVKQQEEKIITLQQQIDERPANSLRSKYAPTLNSVDGNDKTPAAATGMPQSCADLISMGHTANGLYLIMGTEQVETVYCNLSAIPSDPSTIILIFL